MGSSLLEQYWIEQEKQRPLFSSTRSNIPTIDEQFDRITNRSDVLSSKSVFPTDSQSNSRNLLSSSSLSNMTIKEFCPIKKEEEDEEKSSFKRRLVARLCSSNCKTCLLGFILGGLLAAIALSTLLTIYVTDHSTTTITTTTSTSSTSSSTSTTSTTSSTTSTSSTSTTSTSTTSTTSSTSSTSSTSTTSTTTTSTTSSTTSTSSTSTTSVTETSTTSETTTSRVCSTGDTIVTFDDLTTSGAVPSGYNNIDWTNANIHTGSSNTSGYYTGTVSTPYSIYNSGGTPMTMTSAKSSLLNLYSLAIAAAWYDDLQLTVVGYNSNVVIVNTTFILQVFTVSYLSFIGYDGLDTIIFTTSGGTKNTGVTGGGTQFAMDNICLSFT